MRGIATALTAIALSLVIGLGYCALADQPSMHQRVVFAALDDALVGVSVERATGELPHVDVGKVDEEPQESEQDLETSDGAWEAETELYAAYSGLQNFTGTMGDPDGLNSFDGHYEYDGHTETFYASYAVYDDELWVDDDGFFRTEDGYYVVSTDDYEQGEIVDISVGKAVVMDCGTEDGVLDVHVTWGR